MPKYLTEREGYPGYLQPARCGAAAHHFGSTLGGTLLDAVPQVEKAAASPAGCRHSAGSERGKRRLDLRTSWLLLLSMELDGVLPLERGQVSDGLLQVEPRQLPLPSIHGLGGEPLLRAVCGHFPGWRLVSSSTTSLQQQNSDSALSALVLQTIRRLHCGTCQHRGGSSTPCMNNRCGPQIHGNMHVSSVCVWVCSFTLGRVIRAGLTMRSRNSLKQQFNTQIKTWQAELTDSIITPTIYGPASPFNHFCSSAIHWSNRGRSCRKWRFTLNKC